MLWRTCFALPSLWLAAACSETGTPASMAPPPTRLVYHALTGVSFEMPLNWSEQLEGNALVFSRNDAEGRYLTLTLQAARIDRDDPFSALDAVIGPLVAEPHFRWLRREPALADGEPAVRYDFIVELHESHIRRQGLLLAAGSHWVDVAYAAPPQLFSGGVPVLEEVLRTLHVEAPEAR